MALPDLKKLKISVENLHSEKVKLEKQNAKKPASKGKGKVTLKKESDVSKNNCFFLLNIYRMYSLYSFPNRISMVIKSMVMITILMMITMISCK